MIWWNLKSAYNIIDYDLVFNFGPSLNSLIQLTNLVWFTSSGMFLLSNGVNVKAVKLHQFLHQSKRFPNFYKISAFIKEIVKVRLKLTLTYLSLFSSTILEHTQKNDTNNVYITRIIICCHKAITSVLFYKSVIKAVNISSLMPFFATICILGNNIWTATCFAVYPHFSYCLYTFPDKNTEKIR